MGVQADDESSTGASASFDYALTAETWLLASVGSARSPRDRADVSAASYVFGVDHRFGLVGANFALERWGDSGTVESTDYEAALYFRTDQWQVEVGYERREIDIAYSFTGPLGREIEGKAPLDADGVSLSLNGTLTSRVRLFASATTYDYSRNLTVLPRVAALNLLSASTLTLANSFVDRVATIGFDAELGQKVFSVRIGQDRSAVDGSELSSFEAALLIPAGRRIDLELSLGRASSDVFEPSLYAGVLLIVYGGA